MKALYRSTCLIIISLLDSFLLSAQNPALMPSDPAVRNCSFSNGLTCYVVENRCEKGAADFVLMQRDYSGNEVVCAIEDKIIRNETSLDSTLLHIMRKVSEGRSPADQAVIVSGDLDASSVVSKLKYMSLMIDGSEESPMPEYEWKGDGRVRHSCRPDSLKGLVTLCFEWDAPRVPSEYMNTVQTAVYNKAVREIGDVASRWTRRSLRQNEIPVADVSYESVSSVDGFSDERYGLCVTVSEKDSLRACETVYSVLSSIDNGQTSSDDVSLAEDAYLSALARKAGRSRLNSDYVRLCKEAFLYNAPLAGEREHLAFFRSKSVPESTRREIFSGIAAALLDVGYQSDSLCASPSDIMLTDTLALPAPMEKIKVRSSKKDPFSGGVLWTFANGFKVIYKQMPTDRTLYYSMSLNGGYGNIDDLLRGEGAYFSDYDDLCWISGMKSQYFKHLLNLSGMTMDASVNMFNTVVTGKVQNRNADLMMKALSAFANGRKPDADEVEYYLKSEKMHQTFCRGNDVRSVMDSLMCPGYRYSHFKSAQGLNDSTMDKAEALYSAVTSKMNDGILVIVGDMDPSRLKKRLQEYVGGFKTRESSSRRPARKYHPVSGVSVSYGDGAQDEIIMAISARMPMTAENHMAVEIAAMMLERGLKERLSGDGTDVSLSYARSIYPDERFSFMIRVSGVSGTDDLLQLRESFSESLVQCLDEETLCFCKEYVKHKYSQMMTSPEYWLRVIPLRHLEGKDYTSGYLSKVDAVSMEKIKDILDALSTGAGIEYVIRSN